MIRISISWMVEVIKAVDRLDTIKNDSKISDNFYAIFSAKRRLEDVFNKSVYGPFLRVSREKAHDLVDYLQSLEEKSDDAEYKLSDVDHWLLGDKKEKFEAIFLAEIATIPAYLVLPKENYDIDALLERGFGLFPPNLLKKAPETYKDAQEVGRCLAFECYTACGFHTFRVVESVARRYWDHETAGKARPSPNTLGNIDAQLEICKHGSDKVIEALKQMTKLHRNPLAHPDVILSDDEAGAAIGMSRSVITEMLRNLPEVPPTTGALTVT